MNDRYISHTDMCNLIESIDRLAKTNEQIKQLLEKSHIDDSRGHESIPRGIVSRYKYRDYYDVSNTITTAASSDPNDFDSSVYNVERIYETLGRYADRVNIVNDGTTDLFVLISHGGRTNFSKEETVFAGEVKTYYNVYEIRLRSAIQGHAYRITEYDINNNPSINVSSTITPISINTAGDNIIIAAVAGRRYKIVKLILVCNAAVSITLKSGANSLTGAMPFAANGGLALDDDVHPFELNAGEAFIITLSGNVQVSGWSQHIE